MSRFLPLVAVLLAVSASAAEHPNILFSRADISAIKARSREPILKPVTKRLLERADYLMAAPPLIVSPTLRGQPDAPGELKGLEAARRLQGRVLTFSMALTLTGDKKYRDAAVAELDRALTWKTWVDTAHPPPYDLMMGEMAMTFGLAYDWLYNDLTPDQRKDLREGAEKRALEPYLQAAQGPKPMWWLTAENNWNVVCNGGAAVLALSLGEESPLSSKVLALALPGMNHYWDHLAADGGWDEGTGYWTYAMRYALIAAEALRRAGNPWADKVFSRPGLKTTGYFPIVFNPGKKLSAGFGDSNGRAVDPVFYLLAREFKNPDYAWFQDRAGLAWPKGEGWPREALELIWRPVGESWLPEAKKNFEPTFAPVYTFPDIGWGLMAPNQPDPPYFLAFKNGSLAANHTHLDLNHVSLAYGDTMLLVELGSRPYPADYFGPKRYSYYEQSTAGHNTVLIGGKGQALKRAGKLLGPLKGPGFEELVGVADGAYEVPATKVRRHAVFVDKVYWVILDEIQTPEPQTAELRYHAYGSIEAGGPGRWTVTADTAALDVAVWSDGPIAGSVEHPDGWIKPVNVLSLQAPAARERAVVTVLYPRLAADPKLDAVSGREANGRIEIAVGGRRVSFVRGADGWKTEGVGPAR
jgi:hypothetical protein